METKHGVYGPDSGLDGVAWEVQDSRDRAAEELYRNNKEEIDARDRLAIKRDLLARHESHSAVYQDSGNALYLGFERSGSVYLFARLDIARRLIRFLPLAKTNRTVVVWAPLSKIENIWTWSMIAPKGCL